MTRAEKLKTLFPTIRLSYDILGQRRIYDRNMLIADDEWWNAEYKESEEKQEPKWIPISERLPEKNMPCLVSAGKLLLTQIAIYSDLMGTINHRIFYQGDYGHENFVDITEYVLAWMPLPEPYKAESERECKEVKMRDATPEERESVDKYVKSISRPTGVDFWDLEQKPSGDLISRQASISKIKELFSLGDCYCDEYSIVGTLNGMPSVKQEPKTGQYEKHTDHTDCIWYGSDSGCPVTCSQYRDGWNDAMDYIFKNGKGYQPYRHDG